MVRTLLTWASLIQMTHPYCSLLEYSFNHMKLYTDTNVGFRFLSMSLIDAVLLLVSCNCLFRFFLYLMSNKYFAVFLPSLGIEEKLFHLGELIMKIYSFFVYMLVTIRG